MIRQIPLSTWYFGPNLLLDPRLTPNAIKFILKNNIKIVIEVTNNCERLHLVQYIYQNNRIISVNTLITTNGPDEINIHIPPSSLLYSNQSMVLLNSSLLLDNIQPTEVYKKVYEELYDYNIDELKILE